MRLRREREVKSQEEREREVRAQGEREKQLGEVKAEKDRRKQE